MEVGETVYWSFGVDGEGMTHRVVEADPPRRIVLELSVPQGLTLLNSPPLCAR